MGRSTPIIDAIRLSQMEEDGFLSAILLNGCDDGLAGMPDLNIPSAQDIPFEVQQANVVVQPSRGTKGSSKRTKNFNSKEDEVVCSGWLNISKDPIHGANQPGSTFWSRVHAFFEEHMKDHIKFKVVRTESSVMHRWLTIQKEVNKFCSFYDAILRRNQSGSIIQDKIAEEAAKMFQELDDDNKAFTLIHCWNILKDEDKWKAKMHELAELEKQPSKKKQKSTKVSRPRDVEGTNNDEVPKDVAPETDPTKRPPGIKKAKEALRRGGGEACTEALDKMWGKKEAFDREKEKVKEERFNIALELEKKPMSAEDKKAEAEHKKAEADLIKEEREIMSIDMTSLSPLQRQYYETMQEKIVARRLAN